LPSHVSPTCSPKTFSGRSGNQPGWLKNDIFPLNMPRQPTTWHTCLLKLKLSFSEENGPTRDSWILLNPPESSWIFLNLPESSWILLNPPESSWILLNPPDFWLNRRQFEIILKHSYSLLLEKVCPTYLSNG
jgi:hypothetical protein